MYIATPVFSHKEQAIAAMAAGKHVLVEKPVGIDLNEAQEVLETSKACHVKVGVGMMMRFHTYHQKIKDIIAAGYLGEIVSMRAKFVCWYPTQEGSWRQNKKLAGGGALVDMGVHCIDILQYVSELRACGVSAICNTQTFDYEVDDSASLTLIMDNGAHAHVEANFNISSRVSSGIVEIYGTKGSVIAEGTLAQAEQGKVTVRLLGEDAETIQCAKELNAFFSKEPQGDMYTKEIENFSQAVLFDQRCLADIEDAIHVQKITDAAYESSESGRYVLIQ